MGIVVLGIDLGKNACSLVGLDDSGQVVLRRTFPDEDDNGLSPRIRLLLEDLRREWRALDERIAAFDTEFVALARQDAAARRPRLGVVFKFSRFFISSANPRAFRPRSCSLRTCGGWWPKPGGSQSSAAHL